MIENFSRVVPQAIAAGHRPGGRHHSEDEDLVFLRDQGISRILSLSEHTLNPRLLAQYDLVAEHLPIYDFAAPPLATAVRAVRLLDQWRAEGHAVYVHCAAGYGRSGTILACYFVWQGLSPAEALARIRRLRPGSVETPGQEAAVFHFATLVPTLRQEE